MAALSGGSQSLVGALTQIRFNQLTQFSPDEADAQRR